MVWDFLVDIYEKGNGVPLDISKAQYWYDKIKYYGNNLSDIANAIEGNMYVTFGYIPKY